MTEEIKVNQKQFQTPIKEAEVVEVKEEKGFISSLLSEAKDTITNPKKLFRVALVATASVAIGIATGGVGTLAGAAMAAAVALPVELVVEPVLDAAAKKITGEDKDVASKYRVEEVEQKVEQKQEVLGEHVGQEVKRQKARENKVNAMAAE